MKLEDGGIMPETLRQFAANQATPGRQSSEHDTAGTFSAFGLTGFSGLTTLIGPARFLRFRKTIVMRGSNTGYPQSS
jgi:hypothetical protein